MTALEFRAGQTLHFSADPLRQLLTLMARDVPVEFAGIYSYYSHLHRLELTADYSLTPIPAEVLLRLQRSLESQIQNVGAEIIHLLAKDLSHTGFQSGLVIRFMFEDEMIGVLAVFSTLPDAYRDGPVETIIPWANMLHTLVENHHLREKQAAAQAIQMAARIIGSQASPQRLVDVLHDHLCPPQVAVCSLMLYGPLQENRPNGPFDYLEIQGSWLRQYGSGSGIGLRFYLDQYADLLVELDQRRILMFDDLGPLAERVDPLLRGFLRVQGAQSLTLIALHAPGRRLGLIALVTDSPYRFSTRELDNFYTISEFLTVGTMAQVLQQQHDLMLNARSAVLDAVADSVIMVLPGPIDTRVLTVNEPFTRLFGVSQETAQGLLLEGLLEQMHIPDEARQELRRRWLRAAQGEATAQSGEFAMMHPDGIPLTLVWYSAPVYHEGRLMGRIYTFHDVTAERTSASLRSNFISWVSHELRTPLTSIRGFAEFILEANGDQLPDLAREYVEIIHQSAGHLNRVFSDIIEIARADTGQLKLNLEDVHLPDVIINAVALLELEYKSRQQTVIMDIDDDLPGVRGDSIRLGQVLTNLLLNAIRYAPPKSKITVVTQHIECGSELPASAPAGVFCPGILVTVTDEGPGIAPDETELVFVPFFRTKEARASKIAGTGLGLTIARSIIERHRGKIWAEGRRRGRHGAVFHFMLPIA